MKKLKIVIVIAVVLTTITEGAIIKNLMETNGRLKHNQKILIESNSKLNSERGEITLKAKELRKVISQDSVLKEALKDSLKVKEKQIKRLTKLSSKTKIKIVTELRDTTIVKTDTVYIAKKFDWSNGWYKAKGLITLLPDKQEINQTITGKDTIYYMSVNKKYKRFFLARWFEKPTPVTKIWNVNPYQTIVVEQSITVK